MISGGQLLQVGIRSAHFKLMAEQVNRFCAEVLAWCLMTTHAHLVAIPNDHVALARAVPAVYADEQLCGRRAGISFRVGLGPVWWISGICLRLPATGS